MLHALKGKIPDVEPAKDDGESIKARNEIEPSGAPRPMMLVGMSSCKPCQHLADLSKMLRTNTIGVVVCAHVACRWIRSSCSRVHVKWLVETRYSGAR